jgi:uncharacterized protein (DUF1697 family)
MAGRATPSSGSTTYVVLVRGINVGKTRSLPMADFRQVCVDVGCEDVVTYIQSGNAVLRSSRAPADLEAALEAGIAAVAGFEAAVMVRTAAEWDDVRSSGVYAEEPDGTKRVVSFLKTAPPEGALDGLDTDRFLPERCTLRGRELFLHLPNGQGRAALPEALGRAMKAGPPATTRNWKTVEKLHEMATTLDAS